MIGANGSGAVAVEGFTRVVKGRRIFEQGGPAHPAYRIQSGCVCLSADGDDGRRIIIAFQFPGDTLCAGVLDSWATAVAVTDCILCKTSAGLGGEQAQSLLCASDEMLHEVITRFGLLSHMEAAERLSWFLRWLADRTGRRHEDQIEVPMSRRDIADFLGIAPETVSRALQTLEERGLIKRRGAHACQLRRLGRVDEMRPPDSELRPSSASGENVNGFAARTRFMPESAEHDGAGGIA